MGNSRVMVFRNLGNGSFHQLPSRDVDEGPYNIRAGDLDGDGRVELITANRLGNTASRLFNRSLSSLSQDCDGNGTLDECDLAGGLATDANDNGIPDSCDPDCNVNGVPDDLDIVGNESTDVNGNGIVNAG